MSLISLVYNAIAPALSAGVPHAAQGNIRGAQLVSLGRPANDGRDVADFYLATADDEAVIKASPGNLLSLNVSLQTEGEIAVWFLLLNQTTEPVDTEVPLQSYPFVPQAEGAGGTSFYLPIVLGRSYYGDAGMRFSTGIAWCFSTTPGVVTKTGPVASLTVNASYI